MRASRGRGACEGVGEVGACWEAPLGAPGCAVLEEAAVACVLGTVVLPLVAVFWVGWEAGCDGPAVETPLGWDCDTEAIVAMDLG